MSRQNTIGHGFVSGKLGEDGVVEKCDMYSYPHVCTPRWCSPPPEGHPSACPKCGATQRTSYLSACWTDAHEWHGGMKVPPVASLAPQRERTEPELSRMGIESEGMRMLIKDVESVPSAAPSLRDKVRAHPLYPQMVESVNKFFPPGIANSGYAINALYDFATSQAAAPVGESAREPSREEKAAKFIVDSGKSVHASDCATSIAPAEEPGQCDCDERDDTDAREFWQNVDRFPKEVLRKLTIWECRKLDEIIVMELAQFANRKVEQATREQQKINDEYLRAAHAARDAFESDCDKLEAELEQAGTRERELRKALAKLVEWDKKWPKKAYIVEYGMISQSEQELNTICVLAARLSEEKA